MPKQHVARVLAAAALAAAALAAPTPVSASGPIASLSATSLDFGTVAWLQSSPTQFLTVTNTGTAPLTFQTIDFTGEPFVPEDFRSPVEGCFFQTLAPGAQCTNQVVFNPKSGGPRSSTMLLFDNAPDSPQRVSLAGSGVGAVVTFAPSSLDFGTVTLGTTSAPRTFALVNTGDGPVAISKVALQIATPDFAISADTCTGSVVGPGQRCSVSMTFTPSSIGLTDGTLVGVFDNVGSGEQFFNVGSEGGGGPHVGILDGAPRLSQGVGTTGTFTLPVFNDGTQPVVISSIALDTSAAGFAIAHDGCSGLTLPVGALSAAPTTCNVDMTFAPPAVGSFAANLVFSDNGFGGTQSIALSSAGFAPAGVTSTAAIDFGFQTSGVTSAPQVVTLTNPSPQPLVVSSVTLGGASPGAFTLSNNLCGGTTIAPGGSCTVAVAIAPPFPYLFTATLTFHDNAGSSPAIGQAVELRGEGIAPTFTISTSRLDFGNVKANVVSPTQSFTVTNTSTSAISFGFIPQTPLNTPSGCSGSIPAGASCTVTVSFQSPGLGAQSALVKVFDPALNQQVVEIDWSGITGQPIIEGPLSFPSFVQVVGTSLSVTGFIRDEGLAPLSFGQLSLNISSPASISVDNCSHQTIAPGTNCSVTITATPTTVGGWFTNLVVPTDTVIGPNPTTLFFHGLVGPPAQTAFFPGSVGFASQIVGSPEQTRVVWLDNGVVAAGGGEALNISTVALGGANPGAFRIVWDGCSGLTVESAFSCPVEVGFDPTAAGTFNASLLYSDNAAGSPQAVGLSGVGLQGAIASPQQVDFGSVVINSKSGPVTVTLTNESTSPVTVSRETLDGASKGDYTVTSETCQNQTLQPAASCQVVLVFRPQALGTRSATLTFTDTASNSPQVVPLTGLGVGK